MTRLLTFLMIGSLSLSALAVGEGPISSLRQWTAEMVAQHDDWGKPACVAYTESSDGESYLEVTALYDQATEQFGEPTVNILTPFDITFFEVTVDVDRVSQDFAFLPVLPTASTGMVGARALFADREELLSALRNRNTVVAKYFDASGEVKSLQFSLSGSNNTINAMFDACELEISELKGLEPLPLP